MVTIEIGNTAYKENNLLKHLTIKEDVETFNFTSLPKPERVDMTPCGGIEDISQQIKDHFLNVYGLEYDEI